MNENKIAEFVNAILIELDGAITRYAAGRRLDDELAAAIFEEVFHRIDFANVTVTPSGHKPATTVDRETLKRVWLLIAFGNFLREKNVRILKDFFRSDH